MLDKALDFMANDQVFAAERELSKLLELYQLYPEFLYGQVLFELSQENYANAQKALHIAKDTFPLVAKELKKKRHARPVGFNEGYVTMGGKDQAYVYWQEYGCFWQDQS